MRIIHNRVECSSSALPLLYHFPLWSFSLHFASTAWLLSSKYKGVHVHVRVYYALTLCLVCACKLLLVSIPISFCCYTLTKKCELSELRIKCALAFSRCSLEACGFESGLWWWFAVAVHTHMTWTQLLLCYIKLYRAVFTFFYISYLGWNVCFFTRPENVLIC